VLEASSATSPKVSTNFSEPLNSDDCTKRLPAKEARFTDGRWTKLTF
jgi:hypothetical protein